MASDTPEIDERKDQIRATFQALGLNPEKMIYNDKLDVFHVNIGTQGTDDHFLKEISEIGASGSVDKLPDPDKLRLMENEIQGKKISDGGINVKEVMEDYHFQIEILPG